ncbi:hypothetical protein EOM82_09655, partial [bacterium]|nr:hypothetical protein [bacterium]
MNIPQFDEIIKINGIPVREYVAENLYPYCWHEKEDSSSWQINSLLPIIEYKKEIAIETESGIYSIKAKSGEVNWQKYESLKAHEKLTEIFKSSTHKISLTDDNIAVITIKTFMESELGKEFYANMPKIKDCRGYIIDIRNNGGGNSDNADCVTQAFIEGEFTYSTNRKMVHIGSYKAWGKYMDLDSIDRNDEWSKKVYD